MNYEPYLIMSELERRLTEARIRELTDINAQLLAALEELVAERENGYHHHTKGFNMARDAIAKTDIDPQKDANKLARILGISTAQVVQAVIGKARG